MQNKLQNIGNDDNWNQLFEQLPQSLKNDIIK
jgi:hypothetical protein